jgi:hypothetical protein
MVVPPYSMRQGPFIWDFHVLPVVVQMMDLYEPVWTCHWLRKAWSQTSCLKRPMRLLPSLIERNKCLFPVADLWNSDAQSLQPEPLPFRNFCKCHTGPQSAGLPTSTAMSTKFSHFQHTLHSIFVPIPSYTIPLIFFGWYWPPFQPQLIVTSVKALISKFFDLFEESRPKPKHLAVDW